MGPVAGPAEGSPHRRGSELHPRLEGVNSPAHAPRLPSAPAGPQRLGPELHGVLHRHRHRDDLPHAAGVPHRGAGGERASAGADRGGRRHRGRRAQAGLGLPARSLAPPEGHRALRLLALERAAAAGVAGGRPLAGAGHSHRRPGGQGVARHGRGRAPCRRRARGGLGARVRRQPGHGQPRGPRRPPARDGAAHALRGRSAAGVLLGLGARSAGRGLARRRSEDQAGRARPESGGPGSEGGHRTEPGAPLAKLSRLPRRVRALRAGEQQRRLSASARARESESRRP